MQRLNRVCKIGTSGFYSEKNQMKNASNEIIKTRKTKTTSIESKKSLKKELTILITAIQSKIVKALSAKKETLQSLNREISAQLSDHLKEVFGLSNKWLEKIDFIAENGLTKSESFNTLILFTIALFIPPL